MAEALVVWIGDGRPCIKAGDDRQLPPTVMTLNKKRGGKCANTFAYPAKISILEHTCLVLNMQYRIATGLFDLQ